MPRDEGSADTARAASRTTDAAAPRLREKVGYGIGDFGFNLYWANISAFLLIFYTDVMGLAAAAVGTMMLVTKVVDAITDPLMGALADRTRSRFGRFRPYLLYGALPLAFTGVAFGLAISNNPMSLYTLYGVIALTGIAVNSAIVLIDAANDRLQRGMSTIHAIIQASRRRVVPILITTTTTIGGLFSLAFGLGGQSLLWGPVAASIVWGLAFSTVLTLFVVPLLYLGFMRPKAARATRRWWHWRRPATA